MSVRFARYSELMKESRDRTNFIKLKRLFLQIERDRDLISFFWFNDDDAPINFALRYYDIEKEADTCFYDYSYNDFGSRIQHSRNFVLALADLFCSLYEDDRGLFQNVFSRILKDCWDKINTKYYLFSQELEILGYIFDGKLLKTISGNPIIEQKINSYIEEKLFNLNPEFIEIREGALNAVLSNSPDKARHVSSSCRTLIDKLLEQLVPNIEEVEGKSKIELRIRKLFGEAESTKELLDNTIKLLNSLRDVQSKGNHSKIDNKLALFIYELTEKLVYFILINIDKRD